MSSFDDDEALFEDIYEEDVKSETKPTTKGSDAEPTAPSEAKKLEEPLPPPPSAPPAPAQEEEVPVAQSLLFGQTQPNVQTHQGGQAQQTASPYGEPYAQQTHNPTNAAPQFGQQPTSMPPSNLGRDSGKMFIGGLNWDTTEDGLVSYFSKYGEILDYTIMKDSSTGRSRGFGFLTFRDPRAVDEVIKKDHILDGKLIDPKRAIAREEQDKVGKIFVGGIDPLVNEKDFNDFFSQFGCIIDAQLMIDKDTGRSRGFGFITFDSPDAVDRVCVNKYLTLKGKAMEVKRAEPRGQHQQNQHNQQQTQQNQYNPYASAYGQMQMPYGQNMAGYAGATPEMMEYWQQMQQWYMFQQQQQQAGNEAGAEPEQMPLNPQLQDGDSREALKDLPKGPGAMRQNNTQRPLGPAAQMQNMPTGPAAANAGRPEGPRGDLRRSNDGRGGNLPKGPRRGGNGGNRDNGGNGGNGGSSGGGRHRGGYKKGGFHPYGGRRRDERR